MRHVLKRIFSVRRSVPKLLGLVPGILSLVCLWAALRIPLFYDGFFSDQVVAVRSFLTAEGIQGLVSTLTVLFGLGSILCLAGLVMAFIRKWWALPFLRGCYIAIYVLAALTLFAVFRITDVVFVAELSRPQPALDAIGMFFWRWSYIWRIGAMLIVVVLAHILSWSRVSLSIYTGHETDEPAPGDLLLENIRTHGREPGFRKSVISSALLHIAVVIIPLLALWLRGGCVEDYRVPYGEGEPVVISIVKRVQPKKKPEIKRILNPMSAILFHLPDLDKDSDIQQQVEEHTRLTYEADPSAVHGKMGAGGGKKGGWPDGMKDGLVRFVRLEYDGEDWNDGMDMITRADVNFLEEFHRVTGFKVARHGESHPISALAKYTKGMAPPFVFMTGANRINVSPRDVKILREYLLDGGMLFADCGGARWHRNFVAFIQSVFPGEPLLVVSDDDPIYQMPYTFANGAPPLWHHGGTRALGIKRGNRWVVYYHPGDMNDAWKTGHSGLRPQLARQSMQLGINIVYHAFTHYLDATRKYRK